MSKSKSEKDERRMSRSISFLVEGRSICSMSENDRNRFANAAMHYIASPYELLKFQMGFKMPPMFRKTIAFLLLVAFVLSPRISNAQTPAPNILVTLAPLDRKTPVELSALTVDAYLSEVDGHTLAQGTLTWKAHNTDTANDVTITVGFPALASLSETFDPTQFSAFRVMLDNKPVVLASATADVVYGDASRDVNWYTFDLKLKPDEKKVIMAEFAQDLGDAVFPRFTYGMLVGNRWKNAVGSARITVNLPAETTGEQFVALDPIVPQFDGKKLTWLWSNLDPEADPSVTFIRPTVWQTLLARRAAAAQNPDDANAHLALGRIYQTLALQNSPRRDNFLAQAVAELETAARLAPNNVDAVKALAQLYEERAGAANGPRDVNYLALAMEQWQKLIGTSADANARKQLGEDSFYLALDAHGHGEYDRELELLNDARNFSPDGAGPLYTKERLENQIRLSHIAAARADINTGAMANALLHVRAVYGDDFEPISNLPPDALALTRASITTTPNERKIVLQFAPYPAPSDGTRAAANQVINALNQTGAGQAQLAEAENGYTLTLTVPFSNDADLRERLVKLAAALPGRTDWTLVRAALIPSLLELSLSDETFARRVHYRETIDLGTGQQAIQGALNEMSGAIGELSKASPDDQEAQLKLQLLNHAQQWWFNQLGSLTLNYQLDLGNGATREWTISVGTPRTLEYDAEVIRGEWYAIGAAGALGVLLLVVVGLMLITRRK